MRTFKLTRRNLLGAGVGLTGAPWLGALRSVSAAQLLGFERVAASSADEVRVPRGYTARVLWAWGDPVGHPAGSPAFKPDASNDAREQALQAGMHHDGMHFFPLEGRNDHGLLAINHEYTGEDLLHPAGMTNWGRAQAEKSMAAVGVSVIEVRLGKTGTNDNIGRWEIVRPSHYARRITLTTPIRIAGEAAGHPLMRTTADPTGTQVIGTMMNCANGWTPWGTYLTCEENFQAYFGAREKIELGAAQRRYGLGERGYPHFQFEPRFDLAITPNEANRFGWVVEIDPYEPQSVPVKRTALGRFRHEVAVPFAGASGRIAFYLCDDEGFEYLYKFVARDAWNAGNRAVNRDLLDHGTLHVARFDAGGKGDWLPLVYGTGPLTSANGFADQATVLIHARLAADALGATRMDRPEGCAVDARSNAIFIACTNNSARGTAGAKEGANPANPRVRNLFGHIVRIKENNDDPAAASFRWDFFALAGDAARPEPEFKGNLRGDAFGSPDNLYLDARGVLWIQTDVSPSALGKGPYAALGNNQMLAADITTGEVRRFLTAPRGAEVAGCVLTADTRTMFVNIQHPGEGSPSTWPDGGRPRSATLVIRRDDGGVIGT